MQREGKGDNISGGVKNMAWEPSKLDSFIVTLGVRYSPTGHAEITHIQAPELPNIRYGLCRDPDEYFDAPRFKEALRNFIIERPQNFFLCALNTANGEKAEMDIALQWPGPKVKDIIEVEPFPVRVEFSKE